MAELLQCLVSVYWEHLHRVVSGFVSNKVHVEENVMTTRAQQAS